MVNLVTIDDQRYLVDVGFGADGPCLPIPLQPGYECTGIAPQMLKLEYKPLPMHSDPAQKVWVYVHKRNPEDPWLDAYAFNEIEFFPEDYEVMNLSTMTSPKSFFTQTVLCVKALLCKETNELEGTLSLYQGEVKKRVKGEVQIVDKFTTEDQRVRGLEKWFGIRLTKDERLGIKYLVSELPN